MRYLAARAGTPTRQPNRWEMFKVRTADGHEVRFNETWPQRRIEWLLAASAFGIGIVYAMSTTIRLLPTYAWQLTVLPQWAWSLWLVGTGIIRLLFLYINGTYRRSPHFRAIGAGLGCFAWFTQFVSVAVSPVVGPTLVLWFLFFAFDVHVALSAAAEAGRADGKAATKPTVAGNGHEQRHAH